MRTAILGTGMYVPEKVVTNDDLAKLMETSDAWIRERTGIVERRYVEGEVGASDLGTRAAHAAIAAAGLAPKDIDAIVLATLSPDYNFPGSAVLVQHQLGIPGFIPALDIRMQCSGFTYGLSIADAWIRAGVYRHVLLVGAEVHSTGLDFTTRGRDVTVIFGDGAGAAVLGPTDDDARGVHGIRLYADGAGARDLWTEVPASRCQPRLSHAHLDEGRHYPKMDGRKVFRNAIVRMPEAVRAVLADVGATPADVKLLIPHQANLRISEMVQRALELRDDQVYNNIQRYGNTTAATIPIALDECVRAGRLSRGDLVVFTTFGAGYSWSAAALYW